MKDIRWFTIPVEGTNMKEINLASHYLLGSRIKGLTVCDIKDRFKILMACLYLRSDVGNLLEQYPAITFCRSRGEDLIKAIDTLFEWYEGLTDEEKGEKIFDSDSDYRFKPVIQEAKEFENVLLAELEKLNAYHAEQKAIYSTPHLISQAEKALTPSVLKKLDSMTKNEIREAGRCLVFDNFTASGFHLMRALEAVLHRYYVLRCKPGCKPESVKPLDNWGAYLKPLYKLCTEDSDVLSQKDKDHTKKVCALLQVIKDQDRNLIMHPEVTLNDEDVIKLFDEVKSAIMAMAEVLKNGEKAKEEP